MEKEIRKPRPTKIGTVVSAGKMDKTITVAVVSSRKHKLYKKVMKKTNKFKVHDEENKAKTCLSQSLGDHSDSRPSSP